MKPSKKKKIHIDLSRRDMIKSAGAAVASLLAGAAVGCAPGQENSAGTGKKKLVMVIDLRKCYGCHACSVACKSENGVVLGNFRSWVNQVNKGKFPLVKRIFVPRLCNHCEKPPCVKVCPTGATYKRDDGLVAVNKETCIGCRYCMSGCPYGVRSFAWKNENPGELPYPSRVPGVVDKCDFCFHRWDNGIVPACVNTCPSGARTAGDLNDPDSDVYRLVTSNPVQTLLPELGTGPQVYYIGLDKDAAESAMKSGVRMIPVELG